ncbi:MAG: phosphatase family protein [Actinomycetia bacterium]|jgi:membrane-associated phospholipid phosphatase|nr:phosphatase family protein [Actinomycetes bacterium]
MKTRRIVWAALLVAGGALIGYAALRTEDGREFDENLFAAANAGHGVRTDRFFGGVTELGSLYAAAAAAGALAITGRRRESARALAGAGATWLLLQGVKRVVDRPRPFHSNPEGTRRMIAEPHGTSWPSSHPAVLTTFTRVAARELGIGVIGRVALTGLDASVAASRVSLGVHYPSDVASGFLFGRAVATLWPRAGAAGPRGRTGRG